MQETMRAIAAYAGGEVRVVEIPRPSYGEYECLVRVRACGLCNGTDLRILHNAISNYQVPYPVILGHEAVGEIVATGEKVRHLHLGDRIICPEGRIGSGAGETTFWGGQKEAGFTTMWGGMAEYGVAKDLRAMQEDGLLAADVDLANDPVQPIPAGMSFQDAVMLLTFKENYSALHNFGVPKGAQVLVYGDGPVGCGISVFLRLMGVGFLANVGHHAERLARLQQLAAPDLLINSCETQMPEALCGRKFDLVVDCTGNMAVVREGLYQLVPGGKLGLYGVLSEAKADFNLTEMPNHTSLHKLNIPYREHCCHAEILRFIAEGKLCPSDFYSHVLPFTECSEGVRLNEQRQSLKVIFTF